MSHDYEDAVTAALQYHHFAPFARAAHDHLVAGALAQQAADAYRRAADSGACTDHAHLLDDVRDGDEQVTTTKLLFRASWRRCLAAAREHAVMAEALAVVEAAGGQQ